MLKRSVLAIIAAFAITQAKADTVTISLSENGGAYTTYTNVPVTGLFGVPFGDWTVYARESQGGIGTQGFEVNLFNGAPSSLWVVITSQDNTVPTGVQDFFSETRLLADVPVGWTVVDQLWFDPNNGVGFSGYQITDPLVFTSPGVVDLSRALDFSNGPYSMTALFAVSAPSDLGNAYSDINTNWSNTAQVPGPIVGAGLPGLLAAIGLFVLGRRRRRA